MFEENKKVQFEEWQRPSNSYSTSNGSKFNQWVINNSGGLVKNEKQANIVLIGIIILAVVISVFLIGGTKESKVDLLDDGLTQVERDMLILEEIEMKKIR